MIYEHFTNHVGECLREFVVLVDTGAGVTLVLEEGSVGSAGQPPREGGECVGEYFVVSVTRSLVERCSVGLESCSGNSFS